MSLDNALVEQVRMSHIHLAFGLPLGLDNPFTILHLRSHGFLNQDMRICPQRRHRYAGVSARRRADVNEVGAFRLEHLLDVIIRRRNPEFAAHRFGVGVGQCRRQRRFSRHGATGARPADVSWLR